MLVNSIYQFQGQHPPQSVDCRLWRVLFKMAIRGAALTKEEDSWERLFHEEHSKIDGKDIAIDNHGDSSQSSLDIIIYAELRRRRIFDDILSRNLLRSNEHLTEMKSKHNHALEARSILKVYHTDIQQQHDHMLQQYESTRKEFMRHCDIYEAIQTLRTHRESLLDANRESIRLIEAELKQAEIDKKKLEERKSAITATAESISMIVDWCNLRIDQSTEELTNTLKNIQDFNLEQDAAASERRKLVEMYSL